MSRRAVILFASLGVAWGIPYLLIKIAVGELDPAVVVIARSALGAVLLLPIAIFRKQLLPVLKRWKPLLAYTIVEIVVPWFFLEHRRAAAAQLDRGPAARRDPAGRRRRRVLLRHPRRADRHQLAGHPGRHRRCRRTGRSRCRRLRPDRRRAALVVVVGYAIGPAIMSRWMSDLPGIGVVAASLAIAAIIYIPIVPLTGDWPTSGRRPR